MTEVDIWLKVMDKLGFLFIEEKTKPDTDINIIEYVWSPTNHSYHLYFNQKTGVVNSLFCVVGEVTKQNFYDQYKNTFRQTKLEGLV